MSSEHTDEGPRANGLGRRLDAIGATLLGLVLRIGVVVWAGGGTMPGDAFFYRKLAERIAEGHGYTWLWDDGAVTPAAHYPVGFPALLAGFDRAATLLGCAPGDALRHPWAAQAFAAVVSAAAIPIIHALVTRSTTSRRAPAIAALLVALHPGLVLYAPALMSEGPTSTLLAACALCAMRVRDAASSGALARVGGWIALLGVACGAATLLRPQSLIFAPVLALLAIAGSAGGTRTRLLRSVAGALVALGVALAMCAPWTARNCREMKRCALVSVNGGWNLLIGTQPSAAGGWAALKTPDACREVWSEAEKDACFEREARKIILAEPVRWLALAPAKLDATLDYAGAGPWWLHASRPDGFGPRAKLVTGSIETLFERLCFLAAVVAVARLQPTRAWARFLLVVAGVFTLQLHVWPAFLALGVACFGLDGKLRGALLAKTTGAAILGTMAVHAAFFGGGRYQVVLFPLLTALAALAFEASSSVAASSAQEGEGRFTGRRGDGEKEEA